MSEVLIRPYHASDLAAIQKIHEASGLDYRLPSMSQFPVLKALEMDGSVRAAYGMRHTVEVYCWLDKSGWADAEQKWLAIKALDREATDAARDLGIDNIVCCVPPKMERFGRRISDKQDGLGFTKIRPDWAVYTKHAAGERQ
jgi:hypothetical protein